MCIILLPTVFKQTGQVAQHEVFVFLKLCIDFSNLGPFKNTRRASTELFVYRAPTRSATVNDLLKQQKKKKRERDSDSESSVSLI